MAELLLKCRVRKLTGHCGALSFRETLCSLRMVLDWMYRGREKLGRERGERGGERGEGIKRGGRGERKGRREGRGREETLQ